MEGHTLRQHTNGAAAELFVAAHLLEEGLEVFLPAVPQSRADFVFANVIGELLRAQVKKATWVRSGPHRYLQCRVQRPSRPPYLPSDWDFLFITDLERIWEFPFQAVENMTSLYLGTDNPNPRKSKRGYAPEDFQIK